MDCSVGTMSVYREGASLNCSGSFYKINYTWKVMGGRAAEGEKPITTIVCEAHKNGFLALGNREVINFL